MTMTKPQDDAGVLAVLIERFETQRLPRLLELQDKVNAGEKLLDYDLNYVEEVMKDAATNAQLLGRHPEYQALSAKVVSLYKEITAKALANEQAG
jgi:phosphotransferase system IIA component